MEIRKFCFILFWFLIVCWQLDHATAYFGGAWCPYKTEKFIPCRVHNGTESYLGPSICWKNFNGSFACTKRMLVRPKFVNTYKKVAETIYRCCPGLQGKNCHQECFNCSTIRLLEERLGYLEKKLHQIQTLSSRRDIDDKTFGSGHKDDDDDQDLDTLNIINDLRGLETRFVNVESQLAKLSHSINEFLMFKSTTEDSIVRLEAGGKAAEQVKEHTQVPIIITTEKTTSTTTTNVPTKKQTIQRLRGLNSHHHQTAIRLLESNKESNLERGDIASTLNDDGDYGEDSILSPSTEEYADQLYVHEYHS